LILSLADKTILTMFATLLSLVKKIKSFPRVTSVIIALSLSLMKDGWLEVTQSRKLVSTGKLISLLVRKKPRNSSLSQRSI
jgi:hypothetical protein